MDLLEQEISKNKSTTSSKKRLILILLMLCIFILFMLLIMISALKGKTPVKDAFFVNGVETQINEKLLITDEAGNKYISIELGAELIGYKFYNGEYGKNEEDRNKCYLENDYEVIGFQLDTKEIYKINLNEKVEPQKFELNSKLEKNSEGMLYITLNDFSKSCNIVFEISQDGRQIKLNTCDYLANLYAEEIKQDNKYEAISNQYYNLKAIYYNMLIVSDGLNYGVIDGELKTIIGTKYKSLIFNEYTESFIAKSNDKYGVLSKEGNVEIEFDYDSIKVLNYFPLLYEVSQNNKYGVLDKEGNIVINIDYDKLGYNYQNEFLLIVKNINNKNENGMIVCKNGKYGLVNIETGKVILDCNLERIYTDNSKEDESTYYVQSDGEITELEQYLKYINTTTVTIPNS